MRNRLFLVFVAMAFVLQPSMLQAQELKVTSIKAATQDLTARRQPREDNNGTPCALVKVQLARAGAKFEGLVVGDCAYDTSEYMVYMAAGAKKLKVKLDGFLPLEISFGDYGVGELESKATYVLSIILPTSGGGSAEQQGPTGSFLLLKVVPANAVVYIDDEPKTVRSDGSVSLLLSRGTHTYRVQATGYVAQTGQVEIGGSKVTKEVSLASAAATLTLTVPMAEADIYLNDERVGQGSWTGKVDAGTYWAEARRQGYCPQGKQFVVSESQTLSIKLDAPEPVYGQLSIDSDPAECTIHLDGKPMGTTPDILSKVSVGKHTLELTHEGYESYTANVEVKEDTEVKVAVTLEKSTSATADKENSGNSKGSEVYFGPTVLVGEGASWNAYIPLALGFYIHNVNLEVSYKECMNDYYLVGSVYWASPNDDSVDERSYGACRAVSGRVGYRVLNKSWVGITPRAGGCWQRFCCYDHSQMSWLTTGRVGVKADVKPLRWLALSLEPEFHFPLAKGELVDQVDDVCAPVRKMECGFDLNVSLNICFVL